MIISSFLCWVICFILLILIVCIIEKFKFPFLKIFNEYVIKGKYPLGERGAIFLAAILILGFLVLTSYIISSIPARVIVVDNVKWGVVDYRSYRAFGNYKGYKVSFLETYLDNRTTCWFVLRPNYYYPNPSLSIPFPHKETSDIIKGDTIVKLKKSPEYLFKGTPTTVRKKSLGSNVRWSLEIY